MKSVRLTIRLKPDELSMLRRIANREALACENLSECVRHLIVREGTKHKTGLSIRTVFRRNGRPPQPKAAP